MAQHSEILIVGGGVIGLSVARQLRKAGVRDIAILERGTLGCEASSAAAGMLAPHAEADSADIFFDLCRESVSLYPEFAGHLTDETGIDAELDKTGTLYLALEEKDVPVLKERYTWQAEAGLAVEKLSRRDVLALEPQVSRSCEFGLLFPNDWQVENRSLLNALRRFVEINDISIHEGATADKLIIENGDVTGVISGSRRYLANTTILTTGAWTSLIKFGGARAPFDVKPIRGQMICYRPEQPLFSHVIYSSRGYIVPRADGRVLAGATVEDVGFDKDVTEAGVGSLRSTATEIAPILADAAIVDKWAGLRPFVSDGLPVIGPIPPYRNLVVATGHYRNGILLAPLTAKLVTGYVINAAASPYLDAFGIGRFGRSTNAAG